MDVQWKQIHDVGEDPAGPTYRARIWTPPPRASYSWALDEYEIDNALDVKEALVWAENEAAGRPIELFVKWLDTGFSGPDNEVVSSPMMTRIYGSPPDER
jgi:hypothetical protein